MIYSDPSREAEIREEQWDAYCSRFPRCAMCGEVILPDTEAFYDRRYCEYICLDCIADGTEVISEDDF